MLLHQVITLRLTELDPVELEHALRGFLLRLQFADAWMKPLPLGDQRLACIAKYDATLLMDVGTTTIHKHNAAY